MKIQEKKLTTGTLVLDGSHDSLFCRVNGLRKILAIRIEVPRARRLGQVFLGIQLGTKICRLEFLVAQICKLVEPQFVGLISPVVVFVNVQKIVFEYREPLLLLVKAIVGLFVLCKPQFIELHDCVIFSQIFAGDDGKICS